MDKIKNWWQRHKPSKRRLIQLYAALLHNAYIKGFIKGDIYVGPLKNLCAPGFNCYSCPGAVAACPLGALQNALASSKARAPYFVLGILLLYGLILGRTICGWLCPLGLIQELLHKLPTPKLKKGRVTRALSYVKYGLLAVFVIAIPLLYSLQSYPVPAFCKYICPAGTFEGAVGLLSNPANGDKFSMLGILFTRKFIILVWVAALCIFIYRAFCRFLCPLGAIHGLFSKVALLGVKVEPTKCTRCGRCTAVCPMDIRQVGDHECISCGKCVDVCPTQAIQWKGSKILLHPNEGEAPPKHRKMRSSIAWIGALVLLIGIIAYVNWPEHKPADPTGPTSPPATAGPTDTTGPAAPTVPDATAGTTTPPTEPDNTPIGAEVGMRAPDFAAPLYGPEHGDFVLSQQQGKIVVINFWATWCTPCCTELPYFQQLHENYAEDVVIIALHSNLVTDDVQAYLDKQGYTFPFALDTSGDIIKTLGGSTMLPMTVVVDRDGKITYNAVGSVTYEKLISLIAPLL